MEATKEAELPEVIIQSYASVPDEFPGKALLFQSMIILLSVSKRNAHTLARMAKNQEGENREKRVGFGVLSTDKHSTN